MSNIRHQQKRMPSSEEHANIKRYIPLRLHNSRNAEGRGWHTRLDRAG